MGLIGKSAVLASLALAFAATARDGVDIQPASQGKPHDFVYGLSFEGKHGIAVGDHGLLLATRDGGSSWEKLTVPEAKGAYFAIARSGGKCMAGGQEGAILRSDDCRRWEAVRPVTAARILGMHSNSQGTGYAVGGFGTILKTTDWGKTWKPMPVDWKTLLGGDAEPHLYAVHVGADGEATLAGEFELVLRSSEGGGRWEVLHKGQRSLFGLSVGQDGRLFAVGQEGLILRSGDRGRSWTTVPTRTKSILTDIWVSQDGLAAMAVGVRALLLSRDGGASFLADTSAAATRDIHSSVRAVEEQGAGHKVFVGGARGEILRTTF